eukprot:327772-Hanusia_phi.AAC.1
MRRRRRRGRKRQAGSWGRGASEQEDKMFREFAAAAAAVVVAAAATGSSAGGGGGGSGGAGAGLNQGSSAFRLLEAPEGGLGGDRARAEKQTKRGTKRSCQDVATTKRAQEVKGRSRGCEGRREGVEGGRWRGERRLTERPTRVRDMGRAEAADW